MGGERNGSCVATAVTACGATHAVAVLRVFSSKAPIDKSEVEVSCSRVQITVMGFVVVISISCVNVPLFDN